MLAGCSAVCWGIILITTVVSWLFSCMLGYNPNHHCCNLAVQEDRAMHMAFQVLSLCFLLSLHCDHPVITTVVTSLFRRMEWCMWGYNPSHRCCILAVQENRVLYKVFQSLSLCPVLSLYFHHRTFHSCNLAVQEEGACCTWSPSLCPITSLALSYLPLL